MPANCRPLLLALLLLLLLPMFKLRRGDAAVQCNFCGPFPNNGRFALPIMMQWLSAACCPAAVLLIDAQTGAFGLKAYVSQSRTTREDSVP
jgi:hypothetical protein